MANVSVAVMAHPDRAHLVDRLVDRLGIPADLVSWDTDGVRWHTGRRAWEMADPAADWHVVIQDDALVCLDLPAGLAKALDHVPDDAILSLFVGRRRPSAQSVENAVVAADAHEAAWIRMRGLNWGVAIGAPTVSIPDMLAWCDRQEAPNYDLRIGRYYLHQLLWPTWCTHPALVDHAEVRSLCGHGDGRVAHRFIGENRSALDVDWAAGHVDMDGIDQLWRARRRRDHITARRHRGTMTADPEVPAMPEIRPKAIADPFRPANARRVHVQRGHDADPAASAGPNPEQSAVVGAGFIDPASTPDDDGYDGHTVVIPRDDVVDDVPRGTPEVAADTPSGDVAAPVDRPPVNAPKAAWVAYATSQGATDADAMTKAKLIDTFG